MENNFNKFVPQGRTKLVNGSVLSPELPGLRLVVVPCSELGKPNTVLHHILDKKWSIIGKQLKGWFAQHVDFKLGSIYTTAVQSDTWAVHMLCYDKEDRLNGLAVEACLKKISTLAISEKASVHFAAPLLEMIPSLSDLVGPYLLNKGIHTYFYDEPAMVEGLVAREAARAAEEQEQAHLAWQSAPDQIAQPEQEVVITAIKPKATRKSKSVSKIKPTKRTKKARKVSSKPTATVNESIITVPVTSTTQPTAEISAADTAFLNDVQKLDE